MALKLNKEVNRNFQNELKARSAKARAIDTELMAQGHLLRRLHRQMCAVEDSIKHLMQDHSESLDHFLTLKEDYDNYRSQHSR